MASSTLSLQIVQGPKQGETLTHTPGTLIKIGRVIKGNTFTIKDPGISQKHILVQFDPEIHKWVLEDLDTSNGTILNDAKISSLVQIPISDGDTIKIGESTKISVKIEESGGENGNNLRRGRSRMQKNVRGLKKEEILEGVLEECAEIKPRRAGLRSRNASKMNESLDSVVERGRPRNMQNRSREAFEKNEEKEGFLEQNKVKEEEEEYQIMDSVVEKINDVQKNVKKGRPRKLQHRSNQENKAVCENNEEKEVENGEEEKNLLVVEDSVDVQNKPKRGRKGNGRNRSTASSTKVLDGDDEKMEGVNEKNEENEGVNEKIEENEVENGEKDKGEYVEEEKGKKVDFEKMTLGEWFDSLEKNLPLAINEAAEEMIASLREKARRYEEYIANVAE